MCLASLEYKTYTSTFLQDYCCIVQYRPIQLGPIILEIFFTFKFQQQKVHKLQEALAYSKIDRFQNCKLVLEW